MGGPTQIWDRSQNLGRFDVNQSHKKTDKQSIYNSDQGWYHC